MRLSSPAWPRALCSPHRRAPFRTGCSGRLLTLHRVLLHPHQISAAGAPLPRRTAGSWQASCPAHPPTFIPCPLPPTALFAHHRPVHPVLGGSAGGGSGRGPGAASPGNPLDMQVPDPQSGCSGVGRWGASVPRSPAGDSDAGRSVQARLGGPRVWPPAVTPEGIPGCRSCCQRQSGAWSWRVGPPAHTPVFSSVFPGLRIPPLTVHPRSQRSPVVRTLIAKEV